MAKNDKLFTLDIEEDDKGVHIHIGGTLGSSLQALTAACQQYCCCRSGGTASKEE